MTGVIFTLTEGDSNKIDLSALPHYFVNGEVLYELEVPDAHDERLAELLNKLSANESIRDYLASCGVQGECGGAEDCPIAVWLSDHMNGETVLVTASRCWVPGRGAVDTPRNVADFIAAFDAGSYPELMSHEEG